MPMKPESNKFLKMLRQSSQLRKKWDSLEKVPNLEAQKVCHKIPMDWPKNKLPEIKMLLKIPIIWKTTKRNMPTIKNNLKKDQLFQKLMNYLSLIKQINQNLIRRAQLLLQLKQWSILIHQFKYLKPSQMLLRMQSLQLVRRVLLLLRIKNLTRIQSKPSLEMLMRPGFLQVTLVHWNQN
jgi:hypothetical protein